MAPSIGVWSSNLLKIWPRNIAYQPGMEAEYISEALPGAVPDTINPQQCPYGLYAEQLSGTAFTMPRHKNRRSWLYRILPAVAHKKMTKRQKPRFMTNDFSKAKVEARQLRWDPLTIPKSLTTFVEGLITYAGAGSPEMRQGLAIHLYTCNESMIDEAFVNSDGDFLIVPQQGDLLIRTEFGFLKVTSGEICVIQRGCRFQVLVQGPSRGYVCEVYGSHFEIPSLGPIGANGLANPKHFKSPVASFERRECEFVITHKFLGEFFEYKQDHSCFDVVGWSGNYVPYKYDLSKYVAVNSVTVDHLDPSIFTVLTAQTNEPGVACCDFVIFPPRWSVHEQTFRPPYYHRNCMTEFMGNIRGNYEAKKMGFLPGGATLHSNMASHGPDAECFEMASKEAQVPVKPNYTNLAFMFESHYILKLTDFAVNGGFVQEDYNDCWQGLKSHFRSTTSKL